MLDDDRMQLDRYVAAPLGALGREEGRTARQVYVLATQGKNLATRQPVR